MTRKLRYLTSAAILLACVCMVLGVLASIPPRPGVTKTNYDRTATRMTKIEITDLLGPPGDLSPNGTCLERSEQWQASAGL
jgi:hypothetical protein